MVSVLGDSTFVHSGITGLVEMVYNPPPTGHVLLILDNGTTAMTGLQEHPGTGRTLEHTQTNKVIFEDLVRAAGIPNVYVTDPTVDPQGFQDLVAESSRRSRAFRDHRPETLFAGGAGHPRIREMQWTTK